MIYTLIIERGLNMKTEELFRVVVSHSFCEVDRPKIGFSIWDRCPGGLKKIETARKKQLKFSDLVDALSWITKNRPGYAVELSVSNFYGVLNDSQNPFIK